MSQRAQVVFAGCPDPSLAPVEPASAKPTAFLDRDGVLNIDRGYVSRVEDFEWVVGARESVAWLRRLGYQVVVVTNQSGISRGYYTVEDFLALSEWLLGEVELDAIAYCPHGPESDCPARKPGTGMLVAAERRLGVDRANSFFVGDKDSDMQAAQAYGVEGLRFAGGNLLEFLQVRLRVG